MSRRSRRSGSRTTRSPLSPSVPHRFRNEIDEAYSPRLYQPSRGLPLDHSAKVVKSFRGVPVASSQRRTVPASISTVLGDSALVRDRASGRVARVFPHSPVLNSGMPGRAFTCARRSIRREVIFATGNSKKGSGARSRARTGTSRERC